MPLLSWRCTAPAYGIDYWDWQQWLTICLRPISNMWCDRSVQEKRQSPLSGLDVSTWQPEQQLRPGIQLDESLPNGQDRGLSAIIDLKLMKDIPDVVLDGLFAQVQIISNFLVRLSICNQAQDRDLSFRQIVLDPPWFLSLLLGH